MVEGRCAFCGFKFSSHKDNGDCPDYATVLSGVADEHARELEDQIFPTTSYNHIFITQGPMLPPIKKIPWYKWWPGMVKHRISNAWKVLRYGAELENEHDDPY